MKKLLIYLLFITLGVIGIMLDGTADVLFMTLFVGVLDIVNTIQKKKGSE